MNSKMRNGLLVLVFFTLTAQAKGPWFDGTYTGTSPLYPDQPITIEFQQNEPKALAVPPFGTRITDLKLSYGAYYDGDQSMEVKLKSDSTGQEWRLVGGIGETKTAILFLPSGAWITIKR